MHGHHTYDAKVFLGFARLHLGYEGGLDYEDDDMGGNTKGVLEEWVIAFLAENIHVFLGRNGGEAAEFWEVVGIKGVELKVMQKRVQLCEKFPGRRIKIED